MGLKNSEISLFTNDFYRDILENLPGAVIISENFQTIILANHSACDLFGFKIEEFRECGLTDILSIDDKLKLTTFSKTNINCKKKNGSYFACEISVSCKNNGGKRLNIIMVNPLKSEEKINSEEKRKSERKFESYFSYSSVAMAIVKPNGYFMDVNEEMCRLMGYSAEEILKLTVMDLTHVDDIQRSSELFSQMINGTIESFRIDKRLIKKNGELIYVTASLVSIPDENGRIEYIISSFDDNTKRIKVEALERHQSQMLRTLVDSLPSAIYVLDNNGGKIISNKVDLELSGYNNEEEVIGKTMQELIPGEAGLKSHIENLEIIRTGKSINNRERYYFLKNWNKKKLFLVSKTPLYDENNKIAGLIGFGKDITALKELEMKIRESEEYFRTLIDISPYGIVIVDSVGVPDYISSKAMELFKIPLGKNLKELSIFDYLAPEYREDSLKKFMESVTGVTYNQKVEYKCIKYNGTPFWAEINSSPLMDASGEIAGLMLVCQDITDRKKTEQELMLALDKAEQGERLTSAMLHNISHEIRTPLNAILGFSDLMTETGVSPESRARYIEIIHSSSDQLLSTINDLVDISAIQARIVKIENSEVCISEVMRGICNKFRMKADEKNIRINLIEPEYSMKSIFFTDKKRLIQIISNLVKNAIKFSGRKDIEIGYAPKGSFMEFYVSDRGIGIAPEYHFKIFEPFFQVEYPEEIRVEGTGMGLALSRAYVELLGGKIWLDSAPGEGSVFHFSIPLKQD